MNICVHSWFILNLKNQTFILQLIEPQHQPGQDIPTHTEPQCPSCGETLSTLPLLCPHCNASVTDQSTQAEQQLREEKFANAFFARRAPVTYAILAFNIAIYLMMALFSPNPVRMLISGNYPAALIAFGAKTDMLIWAGDQWFRLITPIFIHIGFVHLIVNSYTLFMAGPFVERLYGSARFALIYLLSGIGGVLGSFGAFFIPWVILRSSEPATKGLLTSLANFFLRYSNPSAPGAGASGALFGLCGVLLVAGYKYRRILPSDFRPLLGSGILPIIILNLLLGFVSLFIHDMRFFGINIPFIDNAAHIGGLITGIILAMVIPYLSPNQIRLTRAEIAVLIICLLAVAWSFFRAYQVHPPLAPRRTQQVASLPKPLIKSLAIPSDMQEEKI